MNACMVERIIMLLELMLRMLLEIPLRFGIVLRFWLSERVLYCHPNFSPIRIGAMMLMGGNP